MSNKKQHDEEHSKIYKVWLWVKRWWLPIAILLITSIGLACALSIPQRVFETPREPANDKSAPVLLAQSNLRLAFLYITGGAIAVMGLVETFRKNNNEKLKNDQDKEKNDRDHLRQVRAERRERYTKAVEQLGDEKAPVRMGGVYTLVGLVDEWLEEKSLSDDERFKEGQVIINNLCAYIRSPFTLTSYYDELSEDAPKANGIYKDRKQDFYTDKAIFDSEADTRLSIIKEIHDRLQISEENPWDSWSNFEYDFSGSTFFYPIDLTNSYYAKPINFSGSIYQGGADFTGSIYQGGADFTGSIYQGGADFTGSIYQGGADFSRSIYQGEADFSRSTYEGEANFSSSTYEKDVTFSTPIFRSTYVGKADFRGSIYQGWAYFNGSTYEGEANFSSSTYEGEANFSSSTYEKDVTFSTPIFRSTYVGKADFRGSIYQGWAYFNGSTYEGEANFSSSTYEKDVTFSTPIFRSTYVGKADFRGSIYQGWAYFNGSTYEGEADFTGSIYQGGADFTGSIYQGGADFTGSIYQGEADFSRSIFYSETYFGKGKYSNSSSCFTNHAPQFYDKKKRKNTLFGSHNNDFTVDIDKGYPIDLDSKGIPLNCKFLTSEQKEYLADKFREIEKTNNKLLEIKDPKEKAELSKKLQALNEELHKWRE